MKNRTLIRNLREQIGKEVTIAGWVDTRRDHGKIVFLDIRDTTSKVQTVSQSALKGLERLRPEWVVSMTGLVQARPPKLINEQEPNGDIELQVRQIEVLNEAATPPFDLGSDGREIGEEHRLKYRYLDLRRPRLQKNLLLRHRVSKFIRDWLDERGFIEVETPILTKSTPEGARDYVVPSRLSPGKFYALPQSPQQYKQLLMASGVEKYFQIARCFRDEDTRGDRQPEFTQLDLEMAFVEREEVMKLNEELLVNIVEKLLPEKKIQTKPFPRLSYAKAMKKYDTDRPDLRENKEDKNLLAFCWVTDFPFFSAEGGKWTFTHNPFSRAMPEHEPWLLAGEKIDEILTTQYDVVLNGFEIGGGSLRAHRPEALRKAFEIIGYSSEQIAQNFGHMLEALASGCPPHGGIAWGLDRLISILANEPNIREVIAFPKTGEGQDPMMNAPSEIDAKQLKELKIKLEK